jgi:hypothetical protein
MNVNKYAAGFLLAALSFGAASARAKPPANPPKTVIKDARAKQMLLGVHRLSLQWISWDYFGKAVVTEKNGTLYLKGEQRQRRGSDYLRIDGVITEVSAKEFKFDGVVDLRVSHINSNKPCKREGELTFAIKGGRRYWRLQEMDSPCDTTTDYVDLFFR